jgi:hypothetical protein
MNVCCWEHVVTCLDSITQRHPRGAIALNLGGPGFDFGSGTVEHDHSHRHNRFVTWRHLIRAVNKLSNYGTDLSRARTPFALTCFFWRSSSSKLFRPEDDGSTLLRSVSNDVSAGTAKRRRKHRNQRRCESPILRNVAGTAGCVALWRHLPTVLRVRPVIFK